MKIYKIKRYHIKINNIGKTRIGNKCEENWDVIWSMLSFAEGQVIIMKKIPNELSKMMVVLRTILLLAVIFNHTPDIYFMPSDLIQKNIFIYVNQFVMNFVICAVPIYFIMSGYLLYKEDCTYGKLLN